MARTHNPPTQLVWPAPGRTVAAPNSGPERIRVALNRRRERHCQQCDSCIVVARRYRYCSPECFEKAKLAKTRASRLRYRNEHGRHWPHPPSKYWSPEKLREKNREYAAHYRARRRQEQVARRRRVA
jgi:hypothetical protein